MSKFYQRYLSGLAGGKEGESKSGGDPTAMALSRSQAPVPKAGSAAASSSADAAPAKVGAPTRRVQIINESTDLSNFQLQVHQKPESSKQFLRQAVANHYLFENLGAEELSRLVDCMKSSFSSVGDAIIKQGDVGELFYCLETGNAVATVDTIEVLTYNNGGCFGELALIYNSPRAASVIAKSACKLWTLDLKSFRYILSSSASSTMVKRLEFLKKCQFLDGLSNDQISKLAGAVEEGIYEDGQKIITQGDIGDCFYIIEEGFVRCTQIKSSGREVDLIKLKTGDYFGEMALMLNETRHANCIASGRTKCLFLDKAKFYMLLGGVQDILAKRMRIRILQSVPLLARLTEAKLVKLAGVMRVQSFNDGQYIIRQGEDGSRFYIINEGEVRCTRNVTQKQEEELIRLTPMEFFGERALITNETRKANVIACGHVECLVLERTSFQSLLTEVQDDIVTEMTKRDVAKTDNKKLSDSLINEQELLKYRTSYKFEDLKIMRTIGTGTFGRVKVVQHGPTGKVYALKCMIKAQVVSSHQEKNILSEKDLLFESAACPFVLQLCQTYNHPNQIMMLMEFVQGGEMWSYIYEKTDSIARNSFGGFDINAVKFYSANIILAFHYLSARGIAYRDLKPENLLMNNNGYLKVIDFGFAKKFPYTNGNQKLDKTYTLCGTPEYLAPEIVMSKGYDKCVDYWALGCFIYELFLARTPFQADYTTKIFQNIIAAERNLSFPPKMDPLHVNLVKKLLTVNPVYRLGNLSGGVEDIMRDPFLASIDWEALKLGQVKAPYIPAVGNSLDTTNFDAYEEDDDIPIYTDTEVHFVEF